MRMEPMTRNERKAFELASEFYDVVFAQLDAMPILNGEQAGRIAQKVQDFVERQVLQQLDTTGGIDADARERICSMLADIIAIELLKVAVQESAA